MRLSRRFASVFVSASLACSALAMAGCSSSSSPSASGTAPASTAQDPGVDPGTGVSATTPAEGTGTDVNPYGKAYPTKNLGYQQRAGTRPGSIIRNYKFLGYRDGDPSKGTTVISLADFYDPDMRTAKLISFSAGALWCPPCNQEADKLVPLAPTLKQQKVVVIQALIEGDARGTGSTLDDLNVWQKRHNVNYTLFLDPEQKNLGQFFEAAAIPWNALIDARSMEILQSAVGFDPNKMTEEFTRWTTWIDANPAQNVQ
jgi:hypothetical protein